MNWEDLVAALAAAPTLTGARCHSNAPLFDADFDDIRAETITQRTERHEEAKAICLKCPALEACRAWANDTDPGVLAGVVAGVVREAAPHLARISPCEVSYRHHPAVRVVVDRAARTTTASDVADALGISRHTATAALTRAARAGLIQRSEHGSYRAVSSQRIGVSA